jgi:hypothetical protein
MFGLFNKRAKVSAAKSAPDPNDPVAMAGGNNIPEDPLSVPPGWLRDKMAEALRDAASDQIAASSVTLEKSVHIKRPLTLKTPG